jgi:hypothetical protein
MSKACCMNGSDESIEIATLKMGIDGRIIY